MQGNAMHGTEQLFCALSALMQIPESPDPVCCLHCCQRALDNHSVDAIALCLGRSIAVPAQQ